MLVPVVAKDVFSTLLNMYGVPEQVLEVYRNLSDECWNSVRNGDIIFDVESYVTISDQNFSTYLADSTKVSEFTPVHFPTSLNVYPLWLYHLRTCAGTSIQLGHTSRPFRMATLKRPHYYGYKHLLRVRIVAHELCNKLANANIQLPHVVRQIQQQNSNTCVWGQLVHK